MLRNLSIGKRLGLGFLSLLVLLGLIVGIATATLYRINQNGHRLVHQVLDKVDDARTIQSLAQANAMILYQLTMAGTTEERMPLYKSIDSQKQRLQKELTNLGSLQHNATEGDLLGAIKTAASAFSTAFNATANQIEMEGTAKAQASLESQTMPALKHLLDASSAVVRYEQNNMKAMLQQNEHRVSQADGWITLAGILAIALGILLAIGLTRSIVLPIRLAQQAAEAIANGDIGRPLAVKGSDEAAALLHAFNRMKQGLCGMIEAVRREAEGVSGASRHLCELAHAIEEGSGAQSQATQSIASQLLSLGDHAEHTRETAEQAQSLSEDAATLSSQGRKDVTQAANRMNDLCQAISRSSAQVASLQQQSQNISGTVSIIKQIADQTNLLALNAAIEAARASEHGRGFAVVAEEVRALAVRVANATTEIDGMIEEIQSATTSVVSSMEHGTHEMNATAAIVNRIVSPLNELGERSQQSCSSLSTLVAASVEQHETISAISNHVQGIASQADANNRKVGETAGTSAELETLAGRLRQALDRFVIAV